MATPDSAPERSSPLAMAPRIRMPRNTSFAILGFDIHARWCDLPWPPKPPVPKSLHLGAIAQLGERLHGMQEVGGSIPPGSTLSNFEFGKSAFVQCRRSAPASESRGT